MRIAWARLLTKAALPLVSLFIAVILWLYAVGEQSVEVSLKIPLKVEPPKGRMTVLSSTRQNVTLRLSVPRNILSVLSQQSVHAFHQIKEVEKPGEYNFRIEPRDIQLPPGNIRILNIHPEAVTVTLDELIVQKLPLRVPLNGVPAKGYLVDSKKIELNPNAALIEGPKGKLEKLEAIQTQALDVVGRTRSFRRKVSLELDPDLRSITKDLVVDVFVPIQREYGVNVFHDVPVKVLKDPRSPAAVTIQPETVSFALSGPKEVLDTLAASDLLVFIDVSGLEKGAHDIRLEMRLPDEVRLNHEPPVIKVQVQ